MRFDDVVVIVQEIFMFSVSFIFRLFDFGAGGTDLKRSPAPIRNVRPTPNSLPSLIAALFFLGGAVLTEFFFSITNFFLIKITSLTN